MGIKNRLVGVAPELREVLDEMATGMKGDMALSLSPSTLGSSASDVNTAISGDGFTRDVVVKLVDSNGRVHSWSGNEFSISASESTVGDGVCSIVNSLSSIGLTCGEAVISLAYTGTWAKGDTATLTVNGGTIMGETITNKTSVDTLVS